MKVLEERLKEAKTKQQQQQTPARVEGDKFVETVEPFLARSKVGGGNFCGICRGTFLGFWLPSCLLSVLVFSLGFVFRTYLETFELSTWKYSFCKENIPILFCSCSSLDVWTKK